MRDVRVRGVDEEVLAELKAQARRRGRTLNAELQDLLTEAATRPRREMIQRLEELHEAIRGEHGVLPDSTASIREERDRIG